MTFLYCPRCGEMRCGMFCCLANVWEKINEEQEVDVFNVVRQIRMNRPEFVVDEVGPDSSA